MPSASRVPHMFLRNYWYAAAWGHELGGKPVAKRVLDQPVALIRTGNGVAAFDDCCPHRMAPLSLGTIQGDTIACGYHGLRFDCAGTCVEIPGQSNIPPRLRVKTYPAVERWKLVWLWMGEPAQADEAAIPELPWLASEQWGYSHGTIPYECGVELLVDNLMDLSHTTYVHRNTIGTDAVAQTPVKSTLDGDVVRVERQMYDTEPSIMYRKAGGFTGKVDRWQKIAFHPPYNIIIDAGAVPVGTNDKSKGIDTRIINILTPETDRRTLHFWAFARDFAVRDPGMTKMIGDFLVTTFNEDAGIIAGQQDNLAARSERDLLSVNADAGVVSARRVISRLLSAEAAGRA